MDVGELQGYLGGTLTYDAWRPPASQALGPRNIAGCLSFHKENRDHETEAPPESQGGLSLYAPARSECPPGQRAYGQMSTPWLVPCCYPHPTFQKVEQTETIN